MKLEIFYPVESLYLTNDEFNKLEDKFVNIMLDYFEKVYVSDMSECMIINRVSKINYKKYVVYSDYHGSFLAFFSDFGKSDILDKLHLDSLNAVFEDNIMSISKE